MYAISINHVALTKLARHHRCLSTAVLSGLTPPLRLSSSTFGFYTGDNFHRKSYCISSNFGCNISSSYSYSNCRSIRGISSSSNSSNSSIRSNVGGESAEKGVERGAVNNNADRRHAFIAQTKQAQKLKALGNLNEARALLEKNLPEQELAMGSDHVDTLYSIKVLASTYKEMGNFANAIVLLNWVVTCQERTIGADHRDTLITICQLASVQKDLGKFSEAKILLEKALAAQERTLGADHRDTLITLRDLAVANSEQGFHHDAKLQMETALRGQEKRYKSDARNTTSHMSVLAKKFESQGQLEDAKSLLELACQTRERILGPYDDATSYSMVELAKNLARQNKLSDAQKVLERAIANKEHCIGVDHKDTLYIMVELAFVYKEQGNMSGAKKLLEKAVAGRERALGFDHRDTLISLCQLAIVNREQGNLIDAKLQMERVLKGQELRYKNDAKYSTYEISKLARKFESQGHLKEAESLLELVYQSRERILGKNDKNTLQASNQLAAFLQSRSSNVGTFGDNSMKTNKGEEVVGHAEVGERRSKNKAEAVVVENMSEQPTVSKKVAVPVSAISNLGEIYSGPSSRSSRLVVNSNSNNNSNNNNINVVEGHDVIMEGDEDIFCGSDSDHNFDSESFSNSPESSIHIPRLVSREVGFVRGQMVQFDVIAVTHTGIMVAIKNNSNSNSNSNIDNNIGSINSNSKSQRNLRGFITNPNIESFSRLNNNKDFQLGDKNQVGYVISSKQSGKIQLVYLSLFDFLDKYPEYSQYTSSIKKDLDILSAHQDRILESIISSPTKSIPLGDRSTAADIKAVFPGMSKQQFLSATEALDKDKRLVKRGKLTTEVKEGTTAMMMKAHAKKD